MDVDGIFGSYDGRWSNQIACSLSEEETVSCRTAVRNQPYQRRQSLRNIGRNNRGLTIGAKMRQHPSNEMTKPLKMWLYEHRDHPYPSKMEKLILASGSQMTLTQVSNWFANARRRLKNSLGQSASITWSRRVKMYTTHSSGEGKVELSVSSEEDFDMGANFHQLISKNEEVTNPTRDLTLNTFNKSGSEEGTSCDYGRLLPPSPVKDSFMEGCRFPVHKYKHGILQRYLNDAVQHAYMVANQRLHLVTNEERENLILARSKVNSFSGSTSSHDMDRMSPVPSEADTVKVDGEETEDVESLDGSDTRWLELDAALALTNLARARCGQALCL